jgi:pimeloyl-ACP methyl ester carboxylesterase
VLIHSPLVGPTTWSPVAKELERRGRESVVPSLLGVADAAAPRWRHIPEAVRAATADTPNPTVLIGHSGGGLLLPTIADALTLEVAALVFVDSFLPPVSGSLRLAPPGLMDQLHAGARDGVLPRWSCWFGEDAMRELVPEERLRAVLEEEMPRLPLSYFEASVPLPSGWNARPCAYLLSAAGPRGRAPPTPLASRLLAARVLATGPLRRSARRAGFAVAATTRLVLAMAPALLVVSVLLKLF